MAELSTRPETHPPFERISLSNLVETAAAPYLTGQVRLKIMLPSTDSATAAVPLVHPRPELVHGLGNLLQNALEFGRSEVVVAIDWTDRRLGLTIRDDGPGFSAAVLDHVGEPYMSGGLQGRAVKGEPMGLGVFIAQTLLARTGATLRFANRPSGGAEVRIEWPRAAIEAQDATL
jgi:two-component system sensor histidine kinase RegB